MAAYYLDSSALVKRYVTETGSAWVRDLCQEAAHAIFVSELALVEVGSAFARRCHRGEIADEQRRNYLAVFIHDCAGSYHLIPTERPTIERGLDLTQRRHLRGYDALQLASALAANDVLAVAGLPALTFVSADEGLLAAAVTEELPVENPNHH
jgi:predicted nucleic acid-binding protein